ncbi:hypothetical protein MKW92_005797, partial [Papaver armeniacum]
LKHALTMVVTTLSSLKFLIKNENNWSQQFALCWLILALLNGISCFLWDVLMDWEI